MGLLELLHLNFCQNVLELLYCEVTDYITVQFSRIIEKTWKIFTQLFNIKMRIKHACD